MLGRRCSDQLVSGWLHGLARLPLYHPGSELLCQPLGQRPDSSHAAVCCPSIVTNYRSDAMWVGVNAQDCIWTLAAVWYIPV